MLARIKLTIGTKLAITSGLGVLLVAGMLVNQQMTDSSVAALNKVADSQGELLADTLKIESAVAHMQLGVRDIRLARTQDAANRGLETMRVYVKRAVTDIEAALKLVRLPENRERLEKIRTLLTSFGANGEELGKFQRQYIEDVAKRGAIAPVWAKEYETLLAMPALAALSNRREVEAEIRDANAAFHAVRASAWRLEFSASKEQKDALDREFSKLFQMLKHARDAAGDKTVAGAIERLSGHGGDFQKLQEDMSGLSLRAAEIVTTRTLPAANEATSLAAKVTEVAMRLVQEAKVEATNATASAGRIGLGVGALVVIVLIGAAVFGALSVAKPIRRISEVLLELANGNKAVDVPYVGRGDEVGQTANAANTFKENLIRIEKMEAEEKEAEVRAAAERKADRRRLADEVQAAVGQLVETVSSASTELEAAAGTLTSTAEMTQDLSGTVAAASEEASANVQSVASATEEMTSSVNEISRQVQESAKIAGEAVAQAEQTDARIATLSQAASRIGDVVKLITAIAEQTNLLALNATIEAARAGDAGRGFAVVAQEVKALAAQTAKATDEIGTQVASMQEATQDSVAAIKEIGATISRISQIASTIAAAVEEQGAATSEIARNVGEAAKGTAQVAANITDVNRGAGETGSASSQVLS
ncbi:MAG: HAMP domain-containing protein, partial [Variibacter sp.]|nr:HAMP domain-containing protein [Variibacter sp.]